MDKVVRVVLALSAAGVLLVAASAAPAQSGSPGLSQPESLSGGPTDIVSYRIPNPRVHNLTDTRDGLGLRVSCSVACELTVRLFVSRDVAEKHDLPVRTLGREVLELLDPARATMHLRPSLAMRRALRRSEATPTATLRIGVRTEEGHRGQLVRSVRLRD